MAINKLKEDDGSVKWSVRVYEDGRGSKRLNRIFEKKVEAEDFIENFKKSIKDRRTNPFVTGKFEDHTFSEEANNWLKSGEIKFSAAHLVRVKGILKDMLPIFGGWTIDKIGPQFLSGFQQKEKRKGLSNSSVNRATEVICAILAYSAKQQRIPFNPVDGFEKLAREKKERQFLELEEAVSFLSYMNSKYPFRSEKRWVYVVYLLAINTAMRAGEIWGLKVKDFQAKKKFIWVRRQFNRVTSSFEETKGKDTRTVPLNLDLESEIADLILTGRLSSEDTIFRNKAGNPVCHDNFVKWQFQKDVEDWGGKEICFHELRHTAATLMISKGVDLKTVKEICGHKNILTTMEYSHMQAGAIKNVALSFSIVPNSKGNGGRN